MGSYHVLPLFTFRNQSWGKVDSLLELEGRLRDNHPSIVSWHHFRLLWMKRRFWVHFLRFCEVIQRLCLLCIDGFVFLVSMFWESGSYVSGSQSPWRRNPSWLVNIVTSGLRRREHIHILSDALCVGCVGSEFSVSNERMLTSCCANFYHQPSSKSTEVLHFPFLSLHLFDSVSPWEKGHVVARHWRGLLHSVISRVQHLKPHSSAKNTHRAIHNA